ncbi:hypothetical protein ACFWSF_09365 [Streptomyces sp. NPDC058611]|uniref:hypothetical protein n=1 Tax=unclassified Streptomyces TaxID=2593676 RepID=UPI00364C78F3
MYTMRLLSSADRLGLNELLRARQEHQLARGHALSGEGAALVGFVLAEPGPAVLPIGMWGENGLVAAFAVQRADPLDGWSEEERAEPSLVVSHAHTHPGGERLFQLITPWLRGYAAQLEDPPTWIRCTVRTTEVANHLRDDCGWQHVRTVLTWACRHLLQHAPQRNETGVLVRGEGPFAPLPRVRKEAPQNTTRLLA